MHFALNCSKMHHENQYKEEQISSPLDADAHLRIIVQSVVHSHPPFCLAHRLVIIFNERDWLMSIELLETDYSLMETDKQLPYSHRG